MLKRLSIFVGVFLLLIAACTNWQEIQPLPTATSTMQTGLPPSATPTRDLTWLTPDSNQAITPSPTAPPTPRDSGWQILQPGLERRTIDLLDGEGTRLEFIYILRIDPAYFKFEVAYQSETAYNLSQWQEKTGALVVINGGYFSKVEERYLANGLIVVKGQARGESYGDFAGMFAVTPEGPELRWLRQQPYDPQEPLLAALQSFPILIKPGGELGFPSQHEDNLTARRTVIGQDFRGHILFLVADQGYYTLHQLSLALTYSDLELNMALNLDGGPSSGILLAEPYEEIAAYSALPVVITVFATPE